MLRAGRKQAARFHFAESAGPVAISVGIAGEGDALSRLKEALGGWGGRAHVSCPSVLYFSFLWETACALMAPYKYGLATSLLGN